MFISSAWAQQAGGVLPSGMEGIAQFVPLVLIFAVFYFLLIRPQQKKMKEQQDMLSKLADGDEVVTTSGIFGKVKGLTEKVVTLEVADKVCMRFLRSQVAQKVSPELKS